MYFLEAAISSCSSKFVMKLTIAMPWIPIGAAKKNVASIMNSWSPPSNVIIQ